MDFTPRLPSWMPGAKGNMRSVFVGPYHLIRNGDGREELYDVVADPLEKTDLSQSPAVGAELLHIRATLDSLLVNDRRAKK